MWGNAALRGSPSTANLQSRFRPHNSYMASIGTLSSMTVYERLFVKGILKEWDAAVSRRDREAMIKLLDQVELADQAPSIVESALKRTTRSEA